MSSRVTGSMSASRGEPNRHGQVVPDRLCTAEEFRSWISAGATSATRAAALSGTTPVNLDELLNDAAYATRGSGSDVSLSVRYRWMLPDAWSLEARGGGYRWRTDTRVWLGPVLALERVDRGIGYMLGFGPRYQASRAVGHQRELRLLALHDGKPLLAGDDRRRLPVLGFEARASADTRPVNRPSAARMPRAPTSRFIAAGLFLPQHRI